MDVGCTGTCVPISWVEGLELLKMLAARVLQCLSVGLMCWESFANTLYVSAIFPSDKLAAQVLPVCLHISWFEVLEVLEGERCLDRCVSDYHPEMLASLCAYRLVLL